MNNRWLICITTCNRVSAIKALSWEYIEFCRKSPEFDFLISLDGADPATLRYCSRHKIPLIYSVSREGVGLSKNRVMRAYPEFRGYFFIEDDVALIDSDLFRLHLQVAESSGIPHFSLFPISRLMNEKPPTQIAGETIRHALFGSAQINFFTRAGIDAVGGFDTQFAKYRRFGHTEHSYRFVNSGLCEYPFNVIERCLEGYVKWTEPGAVTRVSVATSEHRLFQGEESAIAERRRWLPIDTLSEYRCPPTLELVELRSDPLRWFGQLKYGSWLLVTSFVRLSRRIARETLSMFGFSGHKAAKIE